MIVKGYEYRKGQYVIIEPSELDNLRAPSKHTIAVSQFIDVSELSPEYVEKPYFVTPENDMQRSLQRRAPGACQQRQGSGRQGVVLRARKHHRRGAGYRRRPWHDGLHTPSLRLFSSRFALCSGLGLPIDQTMPPSRRASSSAAL